MPKLQSIRFQKYDEYKHAIFIANATKEPKAFQKLSKYHLNLKTKFPDTFLPIYSNNEMSYATVRVKTKFQDCVPKRLCKDDVYDVKFKVRSGTSEKGNPYVSCIPKEVTLVSKAVEQGELVDLSDSE